MQPFETVLCQCGSGLSRLRCCALDLTSLEVTEPDRRLAPLEAEAGQAHKDGDFERAERLALDVLERAPGRLGALAVLYDIRRARGSARAAEALARRMVVLEPNNFWAVNRLTLLLLGKGDIAAAEQHARNGIRIAPDQAQAHYLIGMVLTEAHKPAVAEFHYLRALALAGSRDPVVLANLALCLKTQGKMQQARALYHESLAAAPDAVHTLLGLARLEEADRQMEASLALLDRCAALDPGNPAADLLRAVVLGRRRHAAEAVALLGEMAARRVQLGPSDLLEKGRLLDQMGRYGDAFGAFDEGKALLRRLTGIEYRAELAAHVAGRLRGFFTARRLSTLPRAAVRRDVPQPLFVLGFPRSGTTLAEQMLSAHPCIAAGDELPIVHEITELMPRMLDSPLGYPEALAELWMGDHREDLDVLRDHYLRKVAQLRIVPDGTAWFTDKMPLNEMHLGLIALLFPDSPLIHVVRHPLDVVLSVFSNSLTHGYFCAYALESTARHYVLVTELVEHYLREMSLKYLRLRYEDIVEAQEVQLRRVLGFIGEEFDARCLAFHENRRYARTASYAQVSERLYSRSRYRYRHYLTELAPVIPILAPVIERLGYEV
jgi:tetratricopeptide (TPR) repeat protein